MDRTDILFTPEAEKFIIERAKRLRNPHDLLGESIVLFNVLKVERKDALGGLEMTKGRHVYVGMERSILRLGKSLLPNSGKQVYLSGFETEKNITIRLVDGSPDKNAFLFFDRGEQGDSC